MGRPKTRTRRLPEEIRTAMSQLFTPAKVMEILGLEENLYSAVRRALLGNLLTPKEERAIRLRWEAWARKVLVSPVPDDLRLPPDAVDTEAL